MTAVEPKEVAGLSTASTQGQESANTVSTSGHIGVFIPCGHAVKDRGALKISYLSFNEEHTVYLGVKEVSTLLRDCGAPGQDLVHIRMGVDGTEILENIGRAYRSRSGKALLLKTIDSKGELSIPWTAFVQVMKGETKKAHVSRISVPPGKPRPAPTSVRIDQGLERGF